MTGQLLAFTPPSGGRASGVNDGLTPRRRARPARVVENDDFARFVSRVVHAYGRRVAAGDVEGLRDLVALDAVVHACTRSAVTGLRGEGFSWSEIADRLGTTRQNAQQRWGGASS